MTLTHTPASILELPDRYDDPATGRSFTVRQDVSPEDPRSWIDPVDSALWAFREPRLHRGTAGIKPDGNLAIDAFARFVETLDEDRALEATRRYLAVYFPEERLSVAIATIRGYSQSDWLDVVCATKEGYGTPEGTIDVFRQWVFGDVWTVSDDDGESLSGIYADSAEKAIAQFRDEFADPDPAAAPSKARSSFVVSWEIDVEDVTTPAAAAARAWQRQFGRRGRPAPDEACVFTVRSPRGEEVSIDLSDEQHAHLFDTPEGE